MTSFAVRLVRFPIVILRNIARKVGINATVFWTHRWIATSARLALTGDGRFEMGAGSRIESGAQLIIGPTSRIRLGAHAIIDRGGEITAVSGAQVSIGHDTYVGNFCNFRSDESICIGSKCYFGQFVSLLDGGYDPRASSGVIGRDYYKTRPIRIGDNVWIGVGVVVLPGVTIGDGAVIGASAVVTKDVPARAIAVGNPARVTSFR